MPRSSRSGTAFLFISMALPVPAIAFPPPPPPSYVMDAAPLLIDPKNQNTAVELIFADDVIAVENGTVVATGKSAWIQWRATERSHYYGRTIGYSYSTYSDKVVTGSLLVIDTFDTIDTNSRSGPHYDPRMSTRSTLYSFGQDHLIHSVQMSKVAGFWIGQPRQ